MIDTLGVPCPTQMFILNLGKSSTPPHDLATFYHIEFSGFFGEPFFFQTPGTAQNMGMIVFLVPLTTRLMETYVHCAAMARNDFSGEFNYEGSTLAFIQLRRNCYLKFTCNR